MAASYNSSEGQRMLAHAQVGRRSAVDQTLTPPPENIPSDMKGDHLGKGSGKLETGSCAIAERFYQRHFNDIINITDRKELGRFFAQIQDTLLSDHTPFPAAHKLGIGGKTLWDVCVHDLSPNGQRHFRQVLFSLSVHGKVCTVFDQGSAIAWKASNTGTGATARNMGLKPLHPRLSTHVAIQRQAPAEVTLKLLELDPESAREPNFDGDLPIQSAITYQATPEVILKLLELYPEGAREWENEGFLPIHNAAHKQAPTEVILKLLDLYPEGAREKSSRGKLPIHNCTTYDKSARVSRCASGEVWMKLLEVYPESAREKDGKGKLPIHDAVLHDAPAEVCLKLLDLYPEGARQKDRGGDLPIHKGVGRDSHPEVDLKLLELYPESASVKGTKGYLPIHRAVFNRASTEVILKLLELYPEGAQESDPNGHSRLPIHYAVGHPGYGDIQVVLKLLELYPEGACVKDSRGKLPIHLAEENHKPAKVVRKLQQLFPQQQGEENECPLHPEKNLRDCSVVGAASDPKRSVLFKGMWRTQYQPSAGPAAAGRAAIAPVRLGPGQQGPANSNRALGASSWHSTRACPSAHEAYGPAADRAPTGVGSWRRRKR